MKIFLDANIFVAAVGSENGASRYIFRIAEKDKTVHLLTSRYVLEEAERNIKKKMSDKYSFFVTLLSSPIITCIEPAPVKFVNNLKTSIKEKDAPVLGSALFSGADILCTLDKEDFFTPKVKALCKKAQVQLFLPGDFLEYWKKQK